MELDSTDLKIIRLLSIDGRMSLSEIGKSIGLSHVAVRARLKKLKDEGIINIFARVKSEKINFVSAILCLEVMDINKYINDYKHCFRIQSMVRASGKYNLIVSVFAEDMNTLNSVLYHCRFTTDKNIRNSSISIASDSDIRIEMPKNRRCRQKCSSCKEFQETRCTGCLLSDAYTGSLKGLF